MSKRRSIIELRGKGYDTQEIAREMHVREDYVRGVLGFSSRRAPTARPHELKPVYKREALKVSLQHKERQACQLAKEITDLRQKIQDLSR